MTLHPQSQALLDAMSARDAGGVPTRESIAAIRAGSLAGSTGPGRVLHGTVMHFQRMPVNTQRRSGAVGVDYST